MADRLTVWLEQLGLGQYAEAFSMNAVAWEHLPDLDHETLLAVGVKIVGHRMTILKAIASLSKEQSDTLVRDSTIVESDESLAAWERHPGERKPVTVLFADITGSTALTENLDAEEAHELLYGATQQMCEAAENNRGTVCRFMGDGVMAMFGAPLASERHAVDACGAALEMQQALRDRGVPIRVGLHSGEVVVLKVGDDKRAEFDASGPMINIAKRMEESASPGSVYMTNTTQALAGESIESETLEPIQVKGATKPVPVFALRQVKLVDEIAHDSRIQFVGRRSELNQFRGILKSCTEQSYGQTIYVRGEPGIGKSRLVNEFAAIATKNGLSTYRGLVLPFGVGKGQDAIRSLVRTLLEIAPGGSKNERLAATEAALSDGRLSFDQMVFVNDLLDLPHTVEQKALYDAMENKTRNSGKQAVVSTLVTATSSHRPTLVIVEDVHWADTLTLAHLADLTKSVADCPALLVLTSRIDGDPLDQIWRSSIAGSPFTSIDLGPLRKQESVEFIGEFIDTGDALAKSCLERAAGNPLFLEQLLRNAREGSTENLPDSIQSLVLARLDRLRPEAKQALQAASVIGQRFHPDALSHLLGVDHFNCDELMEHNLVRAEGDGFLFAHALIQEGVYGSLIRARRQGLHKICADWFDGSDSVLCAEHLTRAADVGAANAYLTAVREHVQKYRFERALELTDRGLALSDPGVIRHQLKCLKGEVLNELNDVESSIVAFSEALDEAIDDEQRCDAWMGLSACKRLTDEFVEAIELLEEAQPVASQHNLTRQLSQIHHLRGNLYYTTGNIEGCHKEHGLALKYAREVDSVEDEARALGGLADAECARGHMQRAYDAFHSCVTRCREIGLGKVEVANQAQMANCGVFLRKTEDALTSSHAAIAAASKAGHLRAEVTALSGICELAVDLGDFDLLKTTSEKGIALADQLQSQAWEAFYLSFSALAQFFDGDSSRAQALAQQAVDRGDASRTFIGGWTLGVLALVADTPALRRRALKEGSELCNSGMNGEAVLHFYHYAIMTCSQREMWDQLGRYVQMLEDFTKDDPLPWADFYVAYGRALAKAAQGDRPDTVAEELTEILEKAICMGYTGSVAGIQAALREF